MRKKLASVAVVALAAFGVTAGIASAHGNDSGVSQTNIQFVGGMQSAWSHGYKSNATNFVGSGQLGGNANLGNKSVGDDAGSTSQTNVQGVLVGQQAGSHGYTSNAQNEVDSTQIGGNVNLFNRAYGW